MEQPLYMAVPLSWEQLLNMIFLKRKILVIKVFR